MTEFELRELVNSGTVLIDSTFETWMAATFALILVAHVSGASLNIYLKSFLTLLYFLVSTLLYFRYIDIAAGVQHIASELTQLEGGPAASSIGFVTLLRSLVFVVGTIATALFLFLPALHKHRD